MKQKLLGVVMGSLVCTSAFAAHSGFNGFYAGFRAGGLSTDAKIQNDSSARFITIFDEDTLTSDGSNNVWNDSVAGDLFFGYGKVLKHSNIYLGGEAYVEFANPTATMIQSSFHTEPNDDEDAETLSTKTEASLDKVGFGIDFRPGYLIDANTLVYGRIGAAFNRETVNSQDQFTFNDLAGSIITNNALNSSKTRDTIGLRLGVGAERRINQRLSATVDYVYTDYGRASVNALGNVNNTVASTPNTVVNGFVNSASGSLATQTLMIGLKYNIA